MPGLQTGRFDAVFSNVNITPERKQIFDDSIPYSRTAVVVVARAGLKDINGPADLKGRLVGAISGGMDGEIPAKEIEKQLEPKRNQMPIRPPGQRPPRLLAE